MASRHGILALAETQRMISHLIPFYRSQVFDFGRTAVFKHNSSTFNPLNLKKRLSIYALDYQYENENTMEAYEFINDFYTQKLSVTVGRGEKMIVIMSEIMWSNLLCGLLIKLVKNIAESDELHSLEVDEDNFLSISEWIENSLVISRKVTDKI